MAEWEIRQFGTVYSDFLNTCDTALQAEIKSRLLTLRQLGNLAREPYSKPVRDGIFECRANTIRHHARLLYCFLPEKKMVILVCVIKKTNKLKNVDIELAIERKKIVAAQQEIANGQHKLH